MLWTLSGLPNCDWLWSRIAVATRARLAVSAIAVSACTRSSRRAGAPARSSLEVLRGASAGTTARQQ